MAYSSIRIIGIKAVLPQWGEFPEDAPRRSDKVEAIQKALYDTDRWFYFYKGITIADGNASVVMTSEAKKDFSLYDTDVPLKECKYCKGMQ